jgi:hypothetical protein
MSNILAEIHRLQSESPDLDPHERLILKACANLLETHRNVPSPRNRLTEEEFLAIPQRLDLVNGMLQDAEFAASWGVTVRSVNRAAADCHQTFPGGNFK